jgi:hypothetical protein
VVDFLEEVQSAHASTIQQAQKASKSAKKGSFQPWMAHFRIANTSFSRSTSWRKSLKSLVSSATKQQRAIDAAISVISNKLNRKTLQQAVKVLQKSMLASNAEDLQLTISRMAQDPPAGTQDEDFSNYRQLSATRDPLIQQGRSTAAEITASMANDFREANPQLFTDE